MPHLTRISKKSETCAYTSSTKAAWSKRYNELVSEEIPPPTSLISRPCKDAAKARQPSYHPPLFSSTLVAKGNGGKHLRASSCSGVLSAVFRRRGFPPSLMRNMSIGRSWRCTERWRMLRV